ncbi:MAG: hypothetical protein JWM93_2536 [Frankiales bacterium]|nr:hypothetical protein [Frankiales bacterium]
MRVLVAYASKHGSTAEIAAAIADELTSAGLTVDMAHASDVTDVSSYDAVVLGSAVYYGRWLAAARGLVLAQGAQLRMRPLWLFASGRVAGQPAVDVEPGHVAAMVTATDAREHHSFAGRLNLETLDWRERVAARVVKAHPGDFRSWRDIRGWARGIAGELLRGGNEDVVPRSGPTALVGSARAAQSGQMDTEQLSRVIAAASLAPSIHNTQPWRFDITPDGSLDVYADQDRKLRAIDPTGRQLAVSCGAAIEFARLAIRSMGFACEVDVLPDLGRPDVLARLTPGAAVPPTVAETALVDAMGRRHTDRGSYDDTRVPAELLDELRVAAEGHGLWLRQIDLPVDRVVVAGALSDSETRLASDPEYVEEVSRWTHRPAGEDGIPVDSSAWPADRVSDVPLRDFSGHAEHRHTAAGDPPSVERDALVLLGSVADDAAAHISTGRGLGWLLLRLTVAGVSAQPLGQVFDDALGRVRLAQDLRLIGYPQLLLRIGYGHAHAQTGRRPVSDVLVSHG